MRDSSMIIYCNFLQLLDLDRQNQSEMIFFTCQNFVHHGLLLLIKLMKFGISLEMGK